MRPICIAGWRVVVGKYGFMRDVCMIHWHTLGVIPTTDFGYMVSRSLIHDFFNTSDMLINVIQANPVWNSGYPCFTDKYLKHQMVCLRSYRKSVSEPGTEPMSPKSYYCKRKSILLSFLLPLSH